MARNDIYGGLKNALEKGASMEQAIQSFINAGYNDIEVREAANMISPGVLTSNVQTPTQAQVPTQTQKMEPQRIPKKGAQKALALAARTQDPVAYPPLGNQTQSQQPPKKQQYVKPKEGAGKIVFLLAVLIILIGLLAVAIIFRNNIIDYLSSLF